MDPTRDVVIGRMNLTGKYYNNYEGGYLSIALRGGVTEKNIRF